MGHTFHTACHPSHPTSASPVSGRSDSKLTEVKKAKQHALKNPSVVPLLN
jgi:hypothetical protein